MQNCSFDVILFRMSEQNSSSSDLIGLANFSLLDEDFDLDLIPTQKLFFFFKEKKNGMVLQYLEKIYTKSLWNLCQRKPEKITNGQ